MTKKINRLEDWLSAHDSAQFLSLKHARPIPPSYVRQLAKSKKQPVRTRSLGYHQLYFKDDILAATIKKKSTPDESAL